MVVPSGILASFHTIAGDCSLELRGGTEISPFDLRDRIEAAGKAGYEGLGFGHRDLEYWEPKYSPADVRALLAGNGITCVELEMLYGWYSLDEKERSRSDKVRQQLLRWAGELGASHIKVGSEFSDQHWDIDCIAEEFSILCAEAAVIGAKVALEPMPVTTIKTPAQALDMFDRSGASNCGLMLDILCMVRGGIPFDSLASLPVDRVIGVELADGLAHPVQDDIVTDAIDYRRRPGDGQFDVGAFIAAIRATGFNRPYGIEILSIENRKLSLPDEANLNFQAAAAALERAV